MPLIAVIGASNELPEGDELEALFDRFLLRLHVDPVSTHGFAGLLALRDPAPVAGYSSFAVSRDELDALRATSAQVALPADVVAVLTDLRAWALAEKVAVSDRRWRKIVKLLQVSALTNDRSEVSIWDCWLLQHCVGDTVEHRRKVYDWYAARVGASAAMDPARLTRIVVAWEQKLKQDRDSRSQRRDANGALLYEGAGSKPSTEPKGLTRAQRGNEPLFLAPTNASADGYRLLRDRTDDGKGYTRAELSGLYVLREGFDHWHDREAYLAESSNWYHQNGALPALMEPTRFHQSYVADCSRQLADIARDVEAYDVRLDEHRTSLNEQIHRHLWVTPEFAVPALATLASTQKEVTVLRARVGSLQKGFDGLPRELDPTIAAAAVIPAATQPAVARVAAAAVTTRRSGS